MFDLYQALWLILSTFLAGWGIGLMLVAILTDNDQKRDKYIFYAFALVVLYASLFVATQLGS